MRFILATERRHEKSDLTLLLFLALLIPAVWWIFLGWDATLSVSGQDGPAGVLPVLRDLARSRGDWSQLLYRPELQGGAAMVATSGCLPVYRWLSWIGLSPLAVMNGSFFFMQLLWGFFSVRIAEDLVQIWGQGSPVESRSGFAIHRNRLGIALLSAFSPVAAWRIGHGHPSIILGALFFLSCTSLIISESASRRTWTSLILAFLTLRHTLENQAHQLVVYSLIFGVPLALALAWAGMEKRGLKEVIRASSLRLLVPVLVGCAAFLFSLDLISNMLSYVLGTDSARGLGRETVTYAFLTGTWKDLLGSLAWTKSLVLGPQGSNTSLHETNYSMGPLLLLLLLVPWRWYQSKWMNWLALGFVFAFVLPAAFSINLRPISDALLALISPLRSFRVPTRALLPFAMIVPVLGSAALLHRMRRHGGERSLGGFFAISALGIGIFYAPSWLREGVAWVGGVLLVAGVWLNRLPRALPASGALVFLGMLSLACFAERLPNLPTEKNLIRQPELLGREITGKLPTLSASALNRVKLAGNLPHFYAQTAFVAGLSTLDGYWSPPIRYMQLLFALARQEFHSTYMEFKFDQGHRNFALISQLYNVGYRVIQGAAGFEYQKLAPTPGEAWFSRTIDRVPSAEEASHRLEAAQAQFVDWIHEHLILAEKDPKVLEAGVPQSLAPACAGATAGAVEAKPHGHKVRVQVQSPELCPLVVPMNYVEFLHAKGRNAQGAWQELKVFPANWALTGVLVPAGVVEVEIEPKSKAWMPAGVSMLLGLLVLTLVGAIPGTQPAGSPSESKLPEREARRPKNRKKAG